MQYILISENVNVYIIKYSEAANQFQWPITLLKGVCFIVTVKLSGGLKNLGSQEKSEVEVAHHPGLTVRSLLTQLGLQVGIIGLALVDGRAVEFEYHLQDNSQVELFPIFGGG